MKSRSLLATSSALALWLAAGAAQADVTAADVYGVMKAQGAAMSQTWTAGSETQEGDTLVVKDLAIVTEGSMGSSTVTISEMRFTELGDGTVKVAMPTNGPLTVKGKDASGLETAMDMSMDLSQVDMIASGTPQELTYTINGPTMSFGMTSMTVGTEKMEFDVSFVLQNVSGTSTLTPGDIYATTSDLTAGTAQITFDFPLPDPAGESVKLVGSVSDLKYVSESEIPSGIDMVNFPAAIAMGLKIDGTITTGAGTYTLDAGGYEPFNGAFGVTGSTAMFKIADGNLAYQFGGTGVEFNMESPGAPMPIAAKMDEYAFGMAFPLVKSDTPSDVGLLVKIVNMTMDEGLWAMFDPTAALPRDPVTTILDLAGKATLTVDFTKPEEMAMMMGFPVKMESLDVKELVLKAIGVDIGATGSFTFDNSMTEMGMPPMPLGALDVTAKGINGLLDKLVVMGMIPEDQLMGVKMMIGMYAKPGAGPDELTTVIEMKEGGQLFANGMQLQ